MSNSTPRHALISHDEAQSLHEAIGMAIEGVGDWRAALDQALAIASVIVSDTDAEGE